MSNLTGLLQDADPLRHEPPRLDDERERLRRTILQPLAVERSEETIRSRVSFVLVAALVTIATGGFIYRLWTHGTTPVIAAVRFEVRLAEEQPGAGLAAARIGDSNRIVYLHPDVVVDNDDIADSWVAESAPGQFEVAVQFLPSGAERMFDATTAHVGRPIAILVDGSVVMAPVIRSPVADSAMITGNYTRDEAERIAEGIGVR
jgi:hypothetical protein